MNVKRCVFQLKRCEPEQMLYLISKTQKMERKEKIPLVENEMLERKSPGRNPITEVLS